MARPVAVTPTHRFEGKLRAWLRGEPLEIWNLFIQFPDGLDLVLVEQVFVKYLAAAGGDGHSIGVAGRRLNPLLALLGLATQPDQGPGRRRRRG